MNRYARTLALAGATALLPVVALAAPASAADVTIRPGDVTENRNLEAGSWEFLADGIAQEAPGADDRSGVYWASASQEFPSSVSANWTGTVAADGQSADNAVVIYIDVDGAGPIPRDALLHEDIYGEGDLWLPESGSTEAKAASPGDSSGSSFAGPIGEWKANLEELYPNLTIVQVGSNLSGDGQGRSQGVLRSVTLGEDTYTFTSQDAPPVTTEEDVNGSVTTVNRTSTSIKLRFDAREQSPNTTAGEKLRWRVAVDKRTAANFTQDFGDRDTFQRVFPRNSGAHEVKVFKNGEQVRRFVIRTNR